MLVKKLAHSEQACDPLYLIMSLFYFHSSTSLHSTMPPRDDDPFAGLSRHDNVSSQEETTVQSQFPDVQKRPPMTIVWKNVIWVVYLHLAALYGLYLLPSAKLQTFAFSK